eukprot:m51a1_g6511 hypothetical protein (539) ;mRNA; f:252077-254086
MQSAESCTIRKTRKGADDSEVIVLTRGHVYTDPEQPHVGLIVVLDFLPCTSSRRVIVYAALRTGGGGWTVRSVVGSRLKPYLGQSDELLGTTDKETIKRIAEQSDKEAIRGLRMPWEVQSATAKPLVSEHPHDDSLLPSLASSAALTSMTRPAEPEPRQSGSISGPALPAPYVPKPSATQTLVPKLLGCADPVPFVPPTSVSTSVVPKVIDPNLAGLKSRAPESLQPSKPLGARALLMPFTSGPFRNYEAHRQSRRLASKPSEPRPLPIPSGFSSSERKACNDLRTSEPDSATLAEATPPEPKASEPLAATEAASGADAEPRWASGEEAAAAMAPSAEAEGQSCCTEHIHSEIAKSLELFVRELELSHRESRQAVKDAREILDNYRAANGMPPLKKHRSSGTSSSAGGLSDADAKSVWDIEPDVFAAWTQGRIARFVALRFCGPDSAIRVPAVCEFLCQNPHMGLGGQALLALGSITDLLQIFAAVAESNGRAMPPGLEAQVSDFWRVIDAFQLRAAAKRAALSLDPRRASPSRPPAE